MKTKYKYIYFERTVNKTGKRNIWRAMNSHHNVSLGLIGWHSPWRCHVFIPTKQTIFSQDCLADIIDFMRQLEKK